MARTPFGAASEPVLQILYSLGLSPAVSRSLG
jgi:hypothetical protein